jgi:hypothetical protein
LRMIDQVMKSLLDDFIEQFLHSVAQIIPVGLHS